MLSLNYWRPQPTKQHVQRMATDATKHEEDAAAVGPIQHIMMRMTHNRCRPYLNRLASSCVWVEARSCSSVGSSLLDVAVLEKLGPAGKLLGTAAPGATAVLADGPAGAAGRLAAPESHKRFELGVFAVQETAPPGSKGEQGGQG